MDKSEKVGESILMFQFSRSLFLSHLSIKEKTFFQTIWWFKTFFFCDDLFGPWFFDKNEVPYKIMKFLDLKFNPKSSTETD